jgi:hypothetical protein
MATSDTTSRRTAEFLMISAETPCWEIERKIAKFLMRAFTSRSTFLFG